MKTTSVTLSFVMKVLEKEPIDMKDKAKEAGSADLIAHLHIWLPASEQQQVE